MGEAGEREVLRRQKIPFEKRVFFAEEKGQLGP